MKKDKAIPKSISIVPIREGLPDMSGDPDIEAETAVDELVLQSSGRDARIVKLTDALSCSRREKDEMYARFDEMTAVIERRRAQEMLEHRNAQLVLINYHSARLHEAATLTQLYKFIIQAVMSVFPQDWVMLCVANEEEHIIRAVAAHGFPSGIVRDTVRPLLHHALPDEDIHSYVCRTGETVTSTDHRSPLHHGKTVEKYKLRGASIVMPMRDRAGVIGTLGFLRPGSDDVSAPIPQEDVEMISAFANEAGIALENLRIYQQLNQQRKRLRDILVSVPVVIWEIWEGADIRALRADFVSDYVRTMLGFAATEWVRSGDFWIAIVHPDDRDRVLLQVDAARKTGEPGDLCFRWIKKDSSVVWVETRLTAIQDEGGATIGFRGVALDITERKNAEEKIRQFDQRLFKQQRMLTHDFMKRLEEERRTVACELHDGVAQYVMASQAFLDTYANRYRELPPESLPDELSRGLKHLSQAVLEVRRLIDSLQTLTLDDLGLAGALEQLLNQEKQMASWKSADFEQNISNIRFGVPLETAIYRVAQEALANVRQHANAEGVHMKLRHEAGSGEGAYTLTLEVADTGKGFAPKEGSGESEHMGLHSMEEHVNLLQGSLDIESAPGKGTRVRAVFPTR